MSLDLLTNQEVIMAARRRLHQGAWDYLVGASESETTMRRNRLGFDRLAFRPRICVDVSNIDASTTFLGHHLRIPVMLAPIGSLQVFDPEGGAASAKAAGEFGTIHIVSSVTEPALEDTAACTPAPKIFQLYVHGDVDWITNILGRVVKSNYAALCLTVDTAVYSRRERPMLTRWTTPTRRDPPDPRWRASITWDLMDQIKEIAGLPFLLKGVATAEDAEIAVQHGVDVIYVSNHGGRQLDHNRGTIEMLPEIKQAVNGRAKIVLDGGIQRGTDVLKALALGADAVAIGKLQGFGLAAAGKDGVVRVLEILEDEIKIAMGLLGITRLDQLTPAYVCQSEPVMLPHEMSQWPNILDGRVQ